MSRPTVTIIGLGRLGKTFARALVEVDIPIQSIFNRTLVTAQKLGDELGIKEVNTFPKTKSDLADITFLTVSDMAIAPVADRLAVIADDFSNKTIVHCSGNESAELLTELKKKGAHVASFHPIQSFTGSFDPSVFDHIYFSLQGDQAAFGSLKMIAECLGASTMEVSSSQKSYLHAAAVMTSNYLNTLIKAAVDIAGLDGLDKEQARRALLPLAKASLQNVISKSFSEALTGPIQRGDIQTVEKHLTLLKDHPELDKMYRILGQKTVELARSANTIDGRTAQKLHKLFGNTH